MKILHLTLMRQWFDEIATGFKTVEYREIKPYWTKRFFDAAEHTIEYDEIHFRNGYGKSTPWMRVKWKGIGYANWKGVESFAIQLGEVLEIRSFGKDSVKP